MKPIDWHAEFWLIADIFKMPGSPSIYDVQQKARELISEVDRLKSDQESVLEAVKYEREYWQGRWAERLEKDGDMNSLIDECGNIQTERDHALMNLELKRKEVERLKSELQEAREETATLEAHIDDWKARAEQAEAKLAECKKEYAKLDEKYYAINDRVNQAETKLSQAEAERDAAYKRFETYAKNNAYWGVENSELKDKIEQAEAKLAVKCNECPYLEAEAKLKQANRYKRALEEIKENGGLCIYGCPDLLHASVEVKEAFRLGSAMAFKEMAKIAQEAIEEKL